MNKSSTGRFSSLSHPPKATSWIVEDDSTVSTALQEMFRISDTDTNIFHNGKALLAALESGTPLPDIICLDLTLPDISGLDLIPSIKKVNPQVPVVVITANKSAEMIERAVECGVYDFLPKNANRTEFTNTVKRAIEYHNLHKQLDAVRSQHAGDQKRPMEPPLYVWLEESEEIRLIALTDVPILISGESGTGKEVLAHMVHTLSARHHRPFVTIQCAGVASEEIERELFGYEPNAFCLSEAFEGALQRANGGTLLIEDIEEIDSSTQAKLVRFLKLKRFTRIGSAKELESDCRIIVTTGCDLRKEVNDQRFRKNLLYQLAVGEVDLQPLRNRKKDIVTLAEHFVRQFCHQFNKRVTLTTEVKEILLDYSWPGNIRELKNIIQSSIIQCNEPFLHAYHLPNRLRHTHDAPTTSTHEAEPITAPQPHLHNTHGSIEEQEKRLILESLATTGGNISRAAVALGISRATLYRKIKKFGNCSGTFPISPSSG